MLSFSRGKSKENRIKYQYFKRFLNETLNFQGTVLSNLKDFNNFTIFFSKLIVFL